MKHFSSADINGFAARQRARFINSLSGFKSANLVATIDEQGITNLAMISSVFHIGASPALVGMIIRPTAVQPTPENNTLKKANISAAENKAVPRNTLANIKRTGGYTINHVSADIYQQAHQTSARYDDAISEFDAVGLTETYIDGVAAPFVQQSQLKFSLSVREIVPLTINNTILVIGEVTHVLVDDAAVKTDGYIDIESLNTTTVSGLDSYHTTQRIARLSYAKTNETLYQLPINGK
ncbi:flavin reductase [Shewanella sp. MMG014]|uniref:flavin reductase family protein n=1 Tax=Shewanella sp. MMG014 TaxID=2822691 RepID=UPI001B362468|nr:flavin reductase [Shewanella sp. MMG014]MBQ4890397.1 flavin reductase [Shewanella sp. MMG014]